MKRRAPALPRRRLPSLVGAALVLAARLAPSVATAGGGFPDPDWEIANPADIGMDPIALDEARDYALTGNGSGMVIHEGKLVASWGDLETPYDLLSTTKSIGSLLVGLAIGDGLFALDDSALTYYPEFGVPPDENTATGWLPGITVRHLATHAAGFDVPGGFSPLLRAPGTAWLYSDCGAQWLGDLLTVRFADDLANVLRTRVCATIGVPDTELLWRDNAYRPPDLNGHARRELASGISASVDAMARLGYLCLRDGRWNGVQVIASSYVSAMRHPDPSIASLPNEDARCPGATSHYGLLWWTNGDGSLAGVPTDAYFSWGLLDSVILVIPSLDLVAVRAGDGWRPDWNADYGVMAPFAGPLARSVLVSAVDRPSWGRLHAAFR